MLYALFGLPVFLFLFIAIIYVANCGLSTNCSQAGLPAIIHTPIPTLVPVTIPTQAAPLPTETKIVCSVTARDLLNAWVTNGYSETQPFTFRDINGNSCQARFADVLTLFTQPNLWYSSVLACDTCHNADVTVAAAGLDMSSYSGILAGSKRNSSIRQGDDILGGGNWAKSILNEQLFVYLNALWCTTRVLAADGPTIQAGILVTNATPAQPKPSQEEVARPGNPGGPGDALNLAGDPTAGLKVYSDHCQICHGEAGTDNVVNPGSDDSTVPPINPIDPTLVSSDYKTFAYNLDLFLQNGSVPEGPNAAFQMPAWGADGGLTQQQIADVIAYVISLNPQ
jgi:mono/diheme cytochrome c family protein